LQGRSGGEEAAGIRLTGHVRLREEKEVTIDADKALQRIERSSTEEESLERIRQQGARGLTDLELLAAILHNGRRDVCASELASHLLRECQGLAGIVGSTHNSLPVRLLGNTGSAVLLACLELGRRIAKAEVPERQPMSNPGAVARYLALHFAVPGQEIMGALFLDTRNRLLGEQEVYRGTLNRAAVEPRAVLKEALLRDAAGFVLFHTHPSGDPSPSAEDLAFTRRIAQSGELMGVRLVDHLILGAGTSWVSLRQRGAW